MYTGLAHGLPVDAALGPARRAIIGAQKEAEFGTPVLFLRAADAQLFELRKAATPPMPPTAPPRGDAALDLDLEQHPPAEAAPLIDQKTDQGLNETAEPPGENIHAEVRETNVLRGIRLTFANRDSVTVRVESKLLSHKLSVDEAVIGSLSLKHAVQAGTAAERDEPVV